MWNKEDQDLISEIVARSVAQSLNQLGVQGATQSGATTGATGTVGQAGTGGVSTTESRQEDIGGGERLTKENATESAILFGNVKAHFDKHIENLQSLTEDTRNHIQEDRDHLNRMREETVKELGQIAFYKQALMKGLVTSDAMITKGAIGVHDVKTEAIRETPGGPQEDKAKA